MRQYIYFRDENGDIYDTVDIDRELCAYYGVPCDYEGWYTPEYTTESWFGTIMPLLYAGLRGDQVGDILCNYWPSLYEVWTDFFSQYTVHSAPEEDD